MIKPMILGLLLPGLLAFSGCSETVYSLGQPQGLTDAFRENSLSIQWSDVKDDMEGVNQEVQIYSAAGELALTITENEEIFYLVRNMEMDKWDYSVQQVPPDAWKLCTRYGFLEQEGEMILQAVNTVYYDQNGYYNVTEAPGGTSQNKITDHAGRYLIELAGLEPNSTQKFSDHEFIYANGYSNTGDIGETGDTPAFFPPFVGMTYEGMLAASAENRIEIHRDGGIVQSISDNQQVYEFLMSMNTEQWGYAEAIPDAAVEQCSIVRYQLGRRQFAGQMMEISRLILYRDGEDFYMEVRIPDTGDGNGDRANTLYPQRFLVPDDIGAQLAA